MTRVRIVAMMRVTAEVEIDDEEFQRIDNLRERPRGSFEFRDEVDDVLSRAEDREIEIDDVEEFEEIEE